MKEFVLVHDTDRCSCAEKIVETENEPSIFLMNFLSMNVIGILNYFHTWMFSIFRFLNTGHFETCQFL